MEKGALLDQHDMFDLQVEPEQVRIREISLPVQNALARVAEEMIEGGNKSKAAFNSAP
jgi:hypothetical protein